MTLTLSTVLLSLLVATAVQAQHMKREHSLRKPYLASGMQIPNWDFSGATIVTGTYVRLTPDRQSKQGVLWNTVRANMHNWEVQIQFKVHGSGKTLFGDGFAFWYTKDRNELGPVFGSKDYFAGLGVFFDTYSNHNGEHSHPHPYVSAVVFNGSQNYDHDRDGTHSELAGCHAQFRNLDTDTHASIIYADRTLVVQLDVDGNFEWQECFTVPDVDLPAGYFYGFSAATGELADNHDILSVKVYELEESENAKDGDAEGDDPNAWATAQPAAKKSAAPRAHIHDSKKDSSNRIVIGIVVVLVVVVLAVVGYFAYESYRQSNSKRLF